jgi:hypothetical protein
MNALVHQMQIDHPFVGFIEARGIIMWCMMPAENRDIPTRSRTWVLGMVAEGQRYIIESELDRNRQVWVVGVIAIEDEETLRSLNVI